MEEEKQLPPWHYRYAGLSVASDLCLPEWQIFMAAQPCHTADVEIRLESTPSEPYSPRLTAEEYRFAIPEVGDYWVEGGRLIRIVMHPNAGEREVRLFLLGSAWGALCYQRGLLVLHSSVVEVNGQAVAFCGASGAGKSSLAAWLVTHGYRLIADDLCHFDLSGVKPNVYQAAPRMKLWDSALHNLGWERENLERDHFRMEKFHVSTQNEKSILETQVIDAPISVRAIYLLGWGETNIVRLTGLAALYQLVEAATYRGELLEPMGAIAAHWQRCAEVARQVAIFRFTRPAEWSMMDLAMQGLLLQLQGELQPESPN